MSIESVMPSNQLILLQTLPCPVVSKHEPTLQMDKLKVRELKCVAQNLNVLPKAKLIISEMKFDTQGFYSPD